MGSMMKRESGFAPFRAAHRLEDMPTSCPGPFNVALQSSVGLKAVQGRGIDVMPMALPSAGQTLGDGRLQIGTHMPLLARRYRYLDLLGEGTSAQVILAEDTLQPGGPLMAIKILKRQHGYAGLKEARALRYLAACSPACGGLVRLRGMFSQAGHVCLVLDRLFPSLLEYLPGSVSLALPARLAHLRLIGHQLLSAVAVMHAAGLVNADLKPENVLLRAPAGQAPGSCPEVALCDFGSAFSETETDTAKLSFEMQTLPYRSPEVVLGLPCGAPLDCWSLGAMLAELALHRPLFACHSPAHLLQQMEQLLGPLPPQFLRSSCRSGLCDAAGGGAGPQPAVAAEQQRIANSRLAGLKGALGSEDCASAWPTLQPRKGHVEGWHERLSPLGVELAKVDVHLAHLVLGLLAYDPAARLGAAAALAHPFFDSVSPVRHLLQVAGRPAGAEASAGGSRPKVEYLSGAGARWGSAGEVQPVQHDRPAPQQRERAPELAPSSLTPAALPNALGSSAAAAAAHPSNAHGPDLLHAGQPVPSAAAGAGRAAEARPVPDQALPAAGDEGGIAPSRTDEPALAVPAQVGAAPEQAACAGGTNMQKEDTRQAPALARASCQLPGNARMAQQPDSLPLLQQTGRTRTQGAAAAPRQAPLQPSREQAPAQRRATDAAGSRKGSSAGRRRERQRAFARLGPSIPGSAHAAGGYTGGFAFPQGGHDADEAAATSQEHADAADGHAPENAAMHAGLEPTVKEADGAGAPARREDQGSAGGGVVPKQASGLRQPSASRPARVAGASSSGSPGLSGPASPRTPESPSPVAWPLAAPDQASPARTAARARHQGSPTEVDHQAVAAPLLALDVARQGMVYRIGEDAESPSPCGVGACGTLLNPAAYRGQVVSPPSPQSGAGSGARKRRYTPAGFAGAYLELVPTRGGDEASNGKREVQSEAEIGSAPRAARGQRGTGATSGRGWLPDQEAAGKGSAGSSPSPEAAGTRCAQAQTEQPGLLIKRERLKEAASNQLVTTASGGKQQPASAAAVDMETSGRKQQRAAKTPAPEKPQQPVQMSTTKRLRISAAKIVSNPVGEQRSPQLPVKPPAAAASLDLLITTAAANAEKTFATPDQVRSSAPGRKVRSSPRVYSAAAVYGEGPTPSKSAKREGAAGKAPGDAGAPSAGRGSKRERSSVKAAKPWWVV